MKYLIFFNSICRGSAYSDAYNVVVSAELKAEVSKEVPSPAAFLYMREVLGDKDGRKAFATAKLKKTLEPNWNEAFQL